MILTVYWLRPKNWQILYGRKRPLPIRRHLTWSAKYVDLTFYKVASTKDATAMWPRFKGRERCSCSCRRDRTCTVRRILNNDPQGPCLAYHWALKPSIYFLVNVLEAWSPPWQESSSRINVFALARVGSMNCSRIYEYTKKGEGIVQKTGCKWQIQRSPSISKVRGQWSDAPYISLRISH